MLLFIDLFFVIKSNTSEELSQSLSSSQYDAQTVEESEEWTLLSEDDTHEEQEQVLQHIL